MRQAAAGCNSSRIGAMSSATAAAAERRNAVSVERSPPRRTLCSLFSDAQPASRARDEAPASPRQRPMAKREAVQGHRQQRQAARRHRGQSDGAAAQRQRIDPSGARGLRWIAAS